MKYDLVKLLVSLNFSKLISGKFSRSSTTVCKFELVLYQITNVTQDIAVRDFLLTNRDYCL